MMCRICNRNIDGNDHAACQVSALKTLFIDSHLPSYLGTWKDNNSRTFELGTKKPLKQGDGPIEYQFHGEAGAIDVEPQVDFMKGIITFKAIFTQNQEHTFTVPTHLS